ncbi:Spo0B domain-containing protein [Oceanobacillus bengalensis]|nr:Spo0B domain-containing protein [Oceanobacillus bengalensis]
MMEELEVVRLLQNYRHDLLNHLQLIQGYLSMGKKDTAESKMTELFSHFEEERKLIQLHAPKFTLWLIHFNHRYDNLRIAYNIHIDRSLSMVDDFILTKCNKIIDLMENYTNPLELYEIQLDIKENELCFYFDGEFKEIIINKEIMSKDIDVSVHEEKIVCRFELPRNG